MASLVSRIAPTAPLLDVDTDGRDVVGCTDRTGQRAENVSVLRRDLTDHQVSDRETDITQTVDIYEQWNAYKFNRQTLHTDHNATTGNCTYDMGSALGFHSFDMSNYKRTETCDVYASDNEGCSSWDYEGPYASSSGGVYAMEWTSDYIRMWTWHPDQVPLDVRQEAPDPGNWGLPGMSVGGDFCDIDRAFKNQSIVFNIDLCGDTAGSGSEWTESCAEETGYNICARYVAAKPGDFQESWFGVRTIKVYTLQ